MIRGLRSARGIAFLAVLVLASLLCDVAGLAFWRMQSDREVRNSLEQRSVVVVGVNDARAHFFQGALLVASAPYVEDLGPQLAAYQSAMTEAGQDLAQTRVELAALGDVEGLAALDNVMAEHDEFGQGLDWYAVLASNSDNESLSQLASQLTPQIWPAATRMIADMEQLAKDQQNMLASDRAAADHAAEVTLTWFLAFGAIAFGGAAVTVVLLVVSIVRPLRSLQESVRAIASGNMDAKASLNGPREVASLAQDFNDMVAARRQAEEALRGARDELELRVRERTAALRAANQGLERLARTDALTQLANHRSLLDSLSREVEVSVRSGRPLAVLMMDIDGFKLFNDTYGHALGDEALKLVAGVLRKVSDGDAIAGRYGGDEFLVVLPGADKAAAKALAERVAAAVGEIEFRAGKGTRVPISLSLGLASFPEDAESKDSLLVLADAAMYEAKRLGGADRRAPRIVAMGGTRFDSAFGALDSLVQAIQYRDRYTKTHSDMVAEYAAKLALQAGLSDEGVRALRIAGVLHDVGKLIIPDDILKKPGPLTAEEYEVIKRHPLVGEMLIRESPFLEDVVQAVGCHHESYDGSGYPRGLRGEEIPLPGRVIAVADVYSAMCMDRPYRKALSQEQIIAELRSEAGTKFDPRLVDLFIEMLQMEGQAQAA